MKTFQQFIYEMSYRGMSKDKENKIKRQMTAAKKSEKTASKKGDFEAAERHDTRYRAMRDRVKKSDLSF